MTGSCISLDGACPEWNRSVYWGTGLITGAVFIMSGDGGIAKGGTFLPKVKKINNAKIYVPCMPLSLLSSHMAPVSLHWRQYTKGIHSGQAILMK